MVCECVPSGLIGYPLKALLFEHAYSNGPTRACIGRGLRGLNYPYRDFSREVGMGCRDRVGTGLGLPLYRDIRGVWVLG